MCININKFVFKETPILILANKQDLPSAKDINEMEKLLSLHELSSVSALHIVSNFESNTNKLERTSSTSCGTSSSSKPSEPQKLWHIQPACAITGEGEY